MSAETGKEKTIKNVSTDNIFKLDGRVPLIRAIPFGIQHVLAMFVANLSPIAVVAAAAKTELTQAQLAMIIQNTMFIAGLATLIQLYPFWRIGAKLPIVMGASFTFVAALSSIAGRDGYPYVMGAVLIGGLFEGTLGLLIKRIARLIKPIVSATVVCGIGISLFPVGMRSFGGGYTDQFGSPKYLCLGMISLVVSLIWMTKAKGYWKALSVLIALIVGYIAAVIMGAVNLEGIFDNKVISLPHLLMFTPKFKLSAILSVAVVFLVSAAETMGDASAVCSSGLGREVTEKELSGAIAVDGYMSSVSSLFGTMPITSFSQNVGLIGLTKVVNRFTIMTGTVVLMIAGCFPVIGSLFAALPLPVLGGCTIMMFGQIFVSGMRMIAKCGFSQKNTTIVALSLAIGVGATEASELGIWDSFPQIVKDVFSSNEVAVVFVIALILSYVLPDDKKKDAEE